MLAPKSPIPLYLQLKSELLASIEAGVWAPGDRMPGDEELGRTYGVSRATVRQALKELELAGLIERFRGRGTFLASAKLRHGPQHQLSHSLQAVGREPGWRVLAAEARPATPMLAAALEVAEGATLFFTRRLRLAGDVPIGVLVAHANVAPQRAPLAALETGSSTDYLAEVSNLNGARAERTLEAVSADAEEATLLGVRQGAPMLRVRRILRAADGRPLEHFLGTYRGDRFQYQTDGALRG
ncbi:MAG: GntR family transcriptional regulator [Myxococcota bacterium]